MYRIIPLDTDNDIFGVYASHKRGAYNTPMVFKGTLDDCITWTRVMQISHDTEISLRKVPEAEG